jgi:hypothetical protein
MNNRRRLLGLLAISALPHLVACGGGPGGGSSAGGNFRATIDGKMWVADANTTQVTASASTPGAVTITGTKVGPGGSYMSLMLALGFIDGAKTYPLGVNQGSNAGGSAQILDQTGGSVGIWMTDFSGARGTVTVTNRTATRFAGTFQFTAPPQLGSTVTTTRTVTDGSFDLALPATFQPPAADDYGSLITATVDGQPWNGATVTGLGDTAAGALSFGGMTTTISLSFVTAMAVQAGGTYDQNGVRITAVNGSTSWGGTSAATSSVTVTSLSAKRVAGTFTATLPPLSGAAAPLSITGGTFDVRVFAAQ